MEHDLVTVGCGIFAGFAVQIRLGDPGQGIGAVGVERLAACVSPGGNVVRGNLVRCIVDASGTRELSLDTGSSYSSDGVAWHEIENIGDTTIVYLIVEPR